MLLPLPQEQLLYWRGWQWSVWKYYYAEAEKEEEKPNETEKIKSAAKGSSSFSQSLSSSSSDSKDEAKKILTEAMKKHIREDAEADWLLMI